MIADTLPPDDKDFAKVPKRWKMLWTALRTWLYKTQVIDGDIVWTETPQGRKPTIDPSVLPDNPTADGMIFYTNLRAAIGETTVKVFSHLEQVAVAEYGTGIERRVIDYSTSTYQDLVYGTILGDQFTLTFDENNQLTILSTTPDVVIAEAVIFGA